MATFAGRGYLIPSIAAAGVVLVTNAWLRPLMRRVIHARPKDGGTHYTITLTCRNSEEAYLRSLLAHALAQAGLRLRSMNSAHIPHTSNVDLTASAVAAKRDDPALEQIVGRLSLEPRIGLALWSVDRTLKLDAGARGSDSDQSLH